MNEMRLLTVVVTDACNFNCSYCPQKKGDRYLSRENIGRFIEFFHPYLMGKSQVNFYGGEPLLAIDAIEYSVDLIKRKNRDQNKNITFNLATNGSLLDDDIIRFLAANHFKLLFSFDGMAQDAGRQEGSFASQAAMIGKLSEHPQIDYVVNSVFSAATVGQLSESLIFIDSLKPRGMVLALDWHHAWSEKKIEILKKEMRKLAEYNLEVLDKEGRIPVSNFRGNNKRSLFACFAGRDRMSIHPGGELWGCHVCSDYFNGSKKSSEVKKYGFGHIERFSRDHKKIYPRVLASWSDFRQDHLYTAGNKFCFLCDDLKKCSTCPVTSGCATGELGVIPDWHCQMVKAQQSAIRWFRRNRARR